MNGKEHAAAALSSGSPRVGSTGSENSRSQRSRKWEGGASGTVSDKLAVILTSSDHKVLEMGLI